MNSFWTITIVIRLNGLNHDSKTRFDAQKMYPLIQFNTLSQCKLMGKAILGLGASRGVVTTQFGRYNSWI